MAATMANAAVNANALQSHSAEDLMQKLDELFEQYLNILDRYQKARQELSGHLSAGHLSLAQANFSNKGRRYGEDYYDERMQAQRLVQISPKAEDADVFDFACVKQESPPVEAPANVDGDDEGDLKEDETKPAPKDPLRWFGVLVPQPLRSAQASFTSAVEGSIPDLVNLQQQMRGLEIEIGRTRKAIKKLGKI